VITWKGPLEGATEIKVIDPYVRLPYQLRNFMEFAQLVSRRKKPEDEVKLHLVTNNNEEFIENVKITFRQMAESLEPFGILFTFEFDNNIHDRSISLDNGWKIILGRGLDIFQKTGGWFDIAEYDQEKRQCKACEITYVWG
jgi:ATP-dependent Lon protease